MIFQLVNFNTKIILFYFNKSVPLQRETGSLKLNESQDIVWELLISEYIDLVIYLKTISSCIYFSNNQISVQSTLIENLF
jgi:hypothetical protein